MPVLRVVFPPPSRFLVDTRFFVMLNGGVIFDGGFKSGLDVRGDVAPGTHVLSTVIEVELFQRTRFYNVVLPPEPAVWTATLDYSRLWGNFTKKLALVREG